MRLGYVLVLVLVLVLALVQTVKCLDLEINGDVSIHLEILNYDLFKNKNYFHPVERKSKAKMKNNKNTDVSLKVLRADLPVNNMTAAPMVECVYQYPEQEQINALLSNMMNQLAKMFIGVRDIMQKEVNRRKQETRFRVISKKDTDFFENIYNNMTKEYRIFYNKTTERVERSGKDPCHHQDEIKEIWKGLLEKSLLTLRRASVQCMEKLLQAKYRNADIISRSRLQEFLMSELVKMRSSQLHMLCDKFQLCFNELL